MKKQIFIWIAAALSALCLACGMAGCKPDGASSDGSDTDKGHLHSLEENQVTCKICGKQLAGSLNFERVNGGYTVSPGLTADEILNDSASLNTPSADGTIIIPSTYNNLPVTSIGDYAFINCTSLKGITIPDSVKELGDYAFGRCANLTSATISDSVRFIGDWVFVGCTNLANITIPDGVKYIGSGAFTGCTNLKGIAIGNGVNYIGSGAFDGCVQLESVFITDIADWCNIDFNTPSANPLYCALNLYLNGQLVTELDIPQEVTKIKDYALYGCKSLKSVTIGNNVNFIGSHAFYGCTNLESVTFKNVTEWYCTQEPDTGGTGIPGEDLQKPETAASYLKDAYSQYFWRRIAA